MNKYTKYLVLKSAIEELFGSDSWYALKESNHVPTWRKYAVKTLKAIQVSISESVDVCDTEWRQEIDKLLAAGIKRIEGDKAIDEIIATLAGTLIRVSFTQIGLMPNRKGSSKSVNLRKESWRLNCFRSVIYTQNIKQKEHQFWSKQQQEIGFDAQCDLYYKYIKSKSCTLYSEWCKDIVKF
ncbi:hypothetical protein BIU88_01765 [Chlorobaculum limnaeum]|uniref:Uncharacterized protein n=1 Tax=Chlorobaculum limnaeum TaxID=274537 RepID=A0A1D8CVT2_CHLLM|nr:hypothetical protein [Chlorobaculum limnaeum]AOS82982.1 hypothetical protein BIU88_01765 [Chlorobaculum limnaeum]